MTASRSRAAEFDALGSNVHANESLFASCAQTQLPLDKLKAALASQAGDIVYISKALHADAAKGMAEITPLFERQRIVAALCEQVGELQIHTRERLPSLQDEFNRLKDAHAHQTTTAETRLKTAAAEIMVVKAATAQTQRRQEQERDALNADLAKLKGGLSYRLEGCLAAPVRGCAALPRSASALAQRVIDTALFWKSAKRRRDAQIKKVRECGLFDAAFYLRTYPDVAAAGQDPATHFALDGAREKRRPHPLFDTAYYLENNPDVADAGENPLLHFARTGGQEGRDPHRWFDSRYYLSLREDVREANANPLLHYLRHGAAEGANPHLLFHTQYYVSNNPDVSRLDVNPLVHFVTVGEVADRSPNSLFDFRFGKERSTESDPTDELIYKAYQKCTLCTSGKPDPLLGHFLWDTYEVARALKLTDLGDNAARIARELTFETPDAIDVSIVIPVYNKAKWTLRCLHSLRLSAPNVAFEVILVDDGSTDETPELIGPIRGLRYVRNAEQLGFLRSCNHGASFARGKYIVLLNNDTVIMPDWLPALLATFEDFDKTGLVGSKLIYPDGRLQEAGGVVWRDASGMNFGRLQDPARPEFNYARDVDYCSGASVMLPLALWKELGGFDELYAPAYYEDTDLAFRVRQAGYRVIYQPRSKAIHFEGLSSGTDLTNGVKRFQAVNQPKFLQRWERELQSYGMPGDDSVHFLDRRVQRHALVVDESTPTPDQDSGSADTFNYLKMLKKANYHVTFIPAANNVRLGRYTTDLQSIGVECLYGPYTHSAASCIKAVGARLDLALFFRYTTAAPLIDLVRAHAPRAKIILETVDLHFLRQEREENVGGVAESARKAQTVQKLELDAIAKSDASIVLSQFELDLTHKLVPGAKLALIPIVRTLPGRLAECAGRRDVVFIGCFRHSPNVDAVKWLAAEVWPLVRKRLPGCRLLVVGTEAHEVQHLACEDVAVLGFVEDLGEILKTCRLTVAPLRFGAGIKGKVVTSLSYGVPCVASPVAVEGTGLRDGEHVLVGETPETIAAAIERLYRDDKLWNTISDNGLRYARKNFSLESAEQKFYALLDDVFADRRRPKSARSA